MAKQSKKFLRKVIQMLADEYLEDVAWCMVFAASGAEPETVHEVSSLREFDYCSDAIDKLPELTDHFDAVAKLSPRWRALVENWEVYEGMLKEAKCCPLEVDRVESEFEEHLAKAEEKIIAQDLGLSDEEAKEATARCFATLMYPATRSLISMCLEGQPLEVFYPVTGKQMRQCVQTVLDIPGLRARLPLAEEECPQWRTIVQHWDMIENWCLDRTVSDDKLEEMLKELLDEAKPTRTVISNCWTAREGSRVTAEVEAHYISITVQGEDKDSLIQILQDGATGQEIAESLVQSLEEELNE